MWKRRVTEQVEEEGQCLNKPRHSVTDYLSLHKLMDRANRTQLGRDFWDSKAYHNRHSPSSQEFEELREYFQDLGSRMLNSKELARVLNANTHPILFSSWLVMSPNATLLAYSGKPDIQRTRDQAALLSQIWRDEKNKLRERDRPTSTSDAYSSSASTDVSTVPEGALETLTIENPTSNIIIRALQPRLLLVLIGGPPPQRKSDFFKVTAEARGDARYPEEVAPADDDPPEELLDHADEEAVIDPTEQREYRDLSEKEKLRMLDIQRKKMDAAAEYMKGDFAARNFVMADESSIP